MLLTGRPDESDRQLAILQAPGFGVVGEPQTLELRVEDDGSAPGPGIPVTVRQDGRVVRELDRRPGTPSPGAVHASTRPAPPWSRSRPPPGPAS